MCYPVWDGAYKNFLAANQKEEAMSAGSRFPSCYQNGILTYVQHHIPVNKMCTLCLDTILV